MQVESPWKGENKQDLPPAYQEEEIEKVRVELKSYKELIQLYSYPEQEDKAPPASSQKDEMSKPKHGEKNSSGNGEQPHGESTDLEQSMEQTEVFDVSTSTEEVFDVSTSTVGQVEEQLSSSQPNVQPHEQSRVENVKVPDISTLIVGHMKPRRRAESENSFFLKLFEMADKSALKEEQDKKPQNTRRVKGFKI